MSVNALRHVIGGSLTFAFSTHTCRILCDVSMTLTTTAHSPQQLMAVWNPPLQDDPEGPTFISNTALLRNSHGFYVTTTPSHSGHTAVSTKDTQVGSLCWSAVGCGFLAVVDVGEGGLFSAAWCYALPVAGSDEGPFAGGGSAFGLSVVEEVSVLVGDGPHPGGVGFLIKRDLTGDIGQDGSPAGDSAGVFG
jgi:hypothetical protein